MGKTVNMAVLVVVVAVLGLIQSSTATTYVVGDTLGWLVPPGGPIAYSTWASGKTFVVGDVLVFNFTTNVHDVAEVTETAFDDCSATSPISLVTDGPASITLTTSGEHFFICTFDSHCSLGQKLDINVSATAASSPAPTTRAPVKYTVGDDLGWLVPPGGAIAYSTWADGKTFIVGDTLEFNFVNGTQDVAEVTEAAYNSCNITSTISISSTTPTTITLATTGEHYFTSTLSTHCSLGQQLAINVTATSTTTTPSSTGGSPPSASFALSSTAVGYTGVILSVMVALLY